MRLLPFLFLLAACSADPEPQPGGLTADDQAQLNDAAEALDANMVDLNAVEQDSPGNEAQP